MLTALFLAAAVIFLCIVCQRVSSRLGVPMLLIFILLGMAFGSDGVVKIWFDDYRLAEQICSTALIFIMFYGGFGTKWHEAKPVAPQAVLLSTMGVVVTAGLTGLFAYFVLHLPFWGEHAAGAAWWAPPTRHRCFRFCAPKSWICGTTPRPCWKWKAAVTTPAPICSPPWCSA